MEYIAQYLSWSIDSERWKDGKKRPVIVQLYLWSCCAQFFQILILEQKNTIRVSCRNADITKLFQLRT